MLLPENEVLQWISLQQLFIFPENYLLDRIVFVPYFMFSEFELEPLGLEIKKFIASLFINNLGLSHSSWIFFSKIHQNCWVQAFKQFASMLSVK